MKFSESDVLISGSRFLPNTIKVVHLQYSVFDKQEHLPIIGNEVKSLGIHNTLVKPFCVGVHRKCRDADG